MSIETEKALLDWENEDRDSGDDLHHHFNDFGRWDWCEISEEARRVWNLMFGQDVEKFSTVDGVWSAAAAQASHGAFAAVAAALGVDVDALELAVSYWMEHQDAPPPAVGAEQLMKLCEEQKTWLDELRAPNAKDQADAA